MRPRKRRGLIRRWVERLLLAAGIVGIGLWAWSNVLPLASQDWDNWVFDSELRQQTATLGTYLADKGNAFVRQAESWCRFLIKAVPEEPWREPALQNAHAFAGNRARHNRDLLGRVTIPRLHLTAIVREGVGTDVLGLAVGHVPGTAVPGRGGNVAIAGHRDTLFRGLQNIQDGDLIQFQTLDGTYNYRVESTQVVSPDDVAVLKAGAHSELTLVTCYPFRYIGPAPERFIVKAEQVSADREPIQPREAARLEERGRPQERPAAEPGNGKLNFTIATHHSKQLAPGISIGIDETDAATGSVNGWLWVMPDRRTVWLRRQSREQPLFFYREGVRRELKITSVSRDSVTGCLIESRTAFPPYVAPNLSAATVTR